VVMMISKKVVQMRQQQKQQHQQHVESHVLEEPNVNRENLKVGGNVNVRNILSTDEESVSQNVNLVVEEVLNVFWSTENQNVFAALV